MPDAAWKPTTRFLVAPAGADLDDVAVRSFRSIGDARHEVEYWERWVPGSRHVIVKAVTTYEAVETPVPDAAAEDTVPVTAGRT